MDEPRQQLLAAIEGAFRGVELGDGVSLHETVIIDNYGGPNAQRSAREVDEKRNWRKLIRDPELVRIGELSCYDAKGFRFHLPTYLSLAVVDFDREDAERVLDSLMYHLTHFSDYNVGRLSILDGKQRGCVRDVLAYLRAEYELESAELDEAIAGYWSLRE